MVVIDATLLMLIFRPDVPARVTDSKGNPIDHVRERVTYLVKTLEGIKSRIIIPTPVLSEILVRATAPDTQRILDEINGAAVFRIEPFETRAAIEVAVLTRAALADGDKKGGSQAPWQKVKFDRQIVAIAKVARASTIYTDDGNLASTAIAAGISVSGLADLPLPPETAQGELPLESRKTDVVDEIAQQAETLEEPETTEGPQPDQPG